MHERKRHFAAQEARDAILAAAGGARSTVAAEGFHPMRAVEAVTDAVIDDCIEEHVQEMLAVCDHAVDVMYAAEFAPAPDTTLQAD